jgi:MOSC domain-containing protein YiiM
MIGEFEIRGIYTGKVAPLGPHGELSAIVKTQRPGAIAVTFDQFGDDEVYDLKHHGGRHRVLHQYANEHYAFWQNKFPQPSNNFLAGSYGENICSAGMTEKDMCIGDIVEIGTAVLQVSEPRYPCGTLNLRYQNNQYLKELLLQTSWGWFYRVLKEGAISASDRGIIIQRLHPELSLDKAIDIMMKRNQNRQLIEKLSTCLELSPKWREKISRFV